MQSFVKYIKQERGSFTLEGTLVFPLVFVLTIGLLFLSLFMYRQAVLYVTAAQAAEKTAFVWDNSYKSLTANAHPSQEHDGLYWRLFGDNALGIYPLSGSAQSASIRLNETNSPDSPSLAQTKLMRIQNLLPGEIKGEAVYTNSILHRKVTVRLQSEFTIPSFLEKVLRLKAVDVRSSSGVIEPAELIRNIDLIRFYIPLIAKEMNPSGMRELLEKFRHPSNSQTDRRGAFHTHAEAKAYLQKLVNGKGASRATKPVGTWRLIDALDSDGVAHQAYFASKTLNKDMLDQMNKDIEMLKRQQVTGVVWHFFRKDNQAEYGPSRGLRRVLEKNGVIVVMHDSS